MPALERGADVIVNMDGDNQYKPEDIPALVKPILEGKAEILVGERPIKEIDQFSLTKKFLQKLGSHVVRIASQTNVADAFNGLALPFLSLGFLSGFASYTFISEELVQGTSNRCYFQVFSSLLDSKQCL